MADITRSLQQELAKYRFLTVITVNAMDASKIMQADADVVVIDESAWSSNRRLIQDSGWAYPRYPVPTESFPPVVLLMDQACPDPYALGLNPAKDDYVVKPFTSEELIARMEAAVKASADLPNVDQLSTPIPSPYASNAVSMPEQAAEPSLNVMPYRQMAYQRIQILESILDTLQTGTCSTPLRKRAIREAHTLAGSLANLGLEHAAQVAEQITSLFKVFTSLQVSDLQQLSQSIQALHQSLANPGIGWSDSNMGPSNPNVANVGSNIDVSSTIQMASAQAIHNYQQQYDFGDDSLFAPRSSEVLLEAVQLLIVDDDVSLSEEIRSLATVRNIHTRLATTLSDARSLVQYYRPDMVLLDLCFPNTAEDGLSFLAELSQIDTSIPVIVFTSQHGLTDRLNAARLGAKGFLQKPISANSVFDVLTRMLQQNQTCDSRLLVMADDEVVVAHLNQLLSAHGFSPTLLSDPTQFWLVLEAVAPDLLILDVNSKQVNGLELCQVVRHDLRWSDLPIILLAEQTDYRTVQEVFAAGADDYVQKPIHQAEFMARVHNRLERSRLLNALAYTDSLTGLTNRCKATADIKRLLYLAERQAKPFSFVIFDLDRFKQINDEYGHLVGDQVLRHTAYAIQQTFRRMDVMARWGGDEFVLGLFDSTAEQSAKRITQLMATLQHPMINSRSSFSLTLTCSVGVAEYPLDGHDLDTLYQSADKALYHSKLNGRDQLSFAQS
ncbi:MAG: diguanylate cyclase, partial [Leptolyngbyaceae bacterium]|nr:diguanylate cyclase [Leptolyngbyaceae bacterium]